MITQSKIIYRHHSRHGAIIAGAAIAAIGAGVSAYGTAQNASAVSDAADFAAYLENQLAKRQRANLDQLITDKEDRLSNINTILDRFDGGAAFGSSDVLGNIREAQSEFAALGAGDFSGFQNQLDNILKSTLANTYGSGAPEGTFTQLAADTVMNLRQGGLQTALQTGEFLSAESYRLLGAEFGIMDQRFETEYMIDRNRVSGITGNQMISAQQQGIGTQAAGSAITQIGGLVSGVGGYFDRQSQTQQQLNLAQQALNQGQAINTRPYSFTTPSVASVPSISSSVPFVSTSPALPSAYGNDAINLNALTSGLGNIPYFGGFASGVSSLYAGYNNNPGVLPPL